MSVTTVKARILEILDTSAEIKKTIRGSVRQLSEMPAAVVMADRAIHEKPASDIKKIIRDYRIIVLVQPMEHGVETAAEQAVEPFYAIVEELFDIRPGLWLVDNSDTLAGVQDSFLTEDTGFQVIVLAGAAWAGAEWILRVEEWKKVVAGQ